jgi:small subunit ribosomal protein S16
LLVRLTIIINTYLFVKEKDCMVRIRLRRIGAKAQPSYRIVIADKEAQRDGRFLEIVGFYNPRTEPATITIKEDSVFEWLKKGAQPSESVVKIFKSAGLTDRFERLKKGEELETLLAEAKAAEAARNTNPKTERGAAPRKKTSPVVA